MTAYLHVNNKCKVFREINNLKISKNEIKIQVLSNKTKNKQQFQNIHMHLNVYFSAFKIFFLLLSSKRRVLTFTNLVINILLNGTHTLKTKCTKLYLGKSKLQHLKILEAVLCVDRY